MLDKLEELSFFWTTDLRNTKTISKLNKKVFG